MHSLYLVPVLLLTLFALAHESADLIPAQLCQPRLGLGNLCARLQASLPTTIAYFGGSITAAAGWRVKTFEWFCKQYPSVAFTEVAAAIGGTGSDLGVFRFGTDVLSHNPDLIFVEFAVNDGGTEDAAIWRQMEGIVRQARTANPMVDICFVYTFRVGYEEHLSASYNPPAASADEKLAEYYGIPSINVALEIVRRASSGSLLYVPAKDADGNALPVPDGVTLFSTDGVHPIEAGHQIYADVVASSLLNLMELPAVGKYPAKPPFVVGHWQAAKMVPIAPSMLSGDWKVLATDDGIGKSFQPFMPKIWEAATPGDSLTFKFRGTTVALYDLLGPDGAQVLITLDGVTQPLIPRFDHYCTYHRLATLKIGEGFEDTIHTVTVEVSPSQPDRLPASSKETGDFDPAKYDGTVLRVGAIMLIGDLVA